jgi:hypothetical protein
MAAQVASALLHEQTRCGYLIDQVRGWKRGAREQEREEEKEDS